MEKLGSQVVQVHDPVTICEGIFSTGELGTTPREQALVVRTRRGLVIVTGCAHPKIERVVRAAKERFGGEIFLVLGGFHLSQAAYFNISSNYNDIPQIRDSITFMFPYISSTYTSRCCDLGALPLLTSPFTCQKEDTLALGDEWQTALSFVMKSEETSEARQRITTVP